MSFDGDEGPVGTQPLQHVAAQRLIVRCPGRHHPRTHIGISLPIGVHVHAADALVGLVKHSPGEALTGEPMPSVPTHVLAVAVQIERTVDRWPPAPRKASGGTNVIERPRPRSKVRFGVLLAERLESQHTTRGFHRRRFGNHEVGRHERATVRSRELLNRKGLVLNVVAHGTSLGLLRVLGDVVGHRGSRRAGPAPTPHPPSTVEAPCPTVTALTGVLRTGPHTRVEDP